MKKAVLVLALLFAGSGIAFADGMTRVTDATTLARTSRTVFNNSGSALTSGTVVVWDNAATGRQFDNSGYPYVTTTTTADSPWTAGVITNSSCADQSLCEIVTEGPAITNIANSTDAVAVSTLVGTTTVVGQAGDYVPAANSCALGQQMRIREAYTGATTGISSPLGKDLLPMWVYVHVSCQ